MAEASDAVTCAVSVATLFNNCVDCLEYVQLGPRFGRDYERCQLKVNIARTRLTRWGHAVSINEDSLFAATSPADPSTQQVRSVFEEIALLFQSLQKASKRYELGAERQDLVPFQPEDMHPTFQWLHGHLGQVAHQRQKKTSLVKEAWVLYDGKSFEKLIGQITDYVDELENICPTETVRGRFVQMEIEEVDDEPALAAFSEAAADVDSLLAEAARQKAHGIAVKNSTGKIRMQEEAGVRVGNEFAEAFLGRDVRVADQTTNQTGDVDVRGKSSCSPGRGYGYECGDIALSVLPGPDTTGS
ncbi:prion-inhibition and propagation-domain-containing protein [Coniochaeta sp. 2T2.1]|nr:prion-inhibition and propagation-domain-containing protein [Coniochaeta sp. 2T2.1]